MKKVLVVVAHPDDEVLGMGGTIAKMSEEGIEVHLLIVTDGSSSQYRGSSNLSEIISNKKKETKKCAEILGIKTITYGNLPDMKLDITPHIDINSIIERSIEVLKPDTVFTHFYGDINLDHRRVFESVLVACRPTKGQCVKNLYCFEVPSSTEWNSIFQQTTFIPNVFVNISEFLDKKTNALGCYTTELREYPHPRSTRYIEEICKSEGLKVGVYAVERFVLVREIKD